jgi:hypothetical protein
VLSPAAFKIGEKYGGYVWFEEDVGIAIPLYEHPEWYQLLWGKPITDTLIASFERDVRRSYPRYFQMREQGYVLPDMLRVGDVLQVTEPIKLSRGPSLMPGDTIQITKLTATYLYAMSSKLASIIKLPIGYYLGATGWGTTEDKVYLTKTASLVRVADMRLAALQSLQRLYDVLVLMKDEGFGLSKLPGSFDKLRNEIYGTKAMVFIGFDSPEERKRGENELEDNGFKVNCSYWPGSSVVEVQVKYFKGWHWDE